MTRLGRQDAGLGVALAVYSMSPKRGSETGFSWRLVTELARSGIRVHAITTARYRDEWDSEQLHDGGVSVHIVPEHTPRLLRKGHIGVYSRYLAWQHRSVPLVESLVASGEVDLVHHYSWAALNFGTPLARLNAPLVVGPLGGGTVMSRPFLRELGMRDQVFERLRSVAVRAGRFNPRIRSLKRNAAALLTTNEDTRSMLRDSRGSVIPVLDTHLDDRHLGNPPPQRPTTGSSCGTTEVVWVGRMLPRKGIMLALDTMAHVTADVHLSIIGDGPEARRVRERLALEPDLASRVSMLGMLPWESVIDHLDRSDLFLFTSYRDAFGSQVLEAASRALPVIGLHHQGIGDFFPKNAGSLVAVEPTDTLVDRLALEIDHFASDAEALRTASQCSLEFANEHSTTAFVENMISIYNSVLEDKTSEAAYSQPGEVAKP